MNEEDSKIKIKRLYKNKFIPEYDFQIFNVMGFLRITVLQFSSFLIEMSMLIRFI